MKIFTVNDSANLLQRGVIHSEELNGSIAYTVELFQISFQPGIEKDSNTVTMFSLESLIYVLKVWCKEHGKKWELLSCDPTSKGWQNTKLFNPYAN